MRIIIAGTRTATEAEVAEALDRCPWIGFVTAVVSGTARGADQFGEDWAARAGVDVLRFAPDWKAFGKRAGPMRNKTMAENGEGLVAVWDGASRGTASMIDLARRLGLRVFVLRTDTHGVEQHAPTGVIAARWEYAEERAGILEYGGGMTRREAERRAGHEARPPALPS